MLVNLLSFFWISGLVTYAVSSVLLTVAYVVNCRPACRDRGALPALKIRAVRFRTGDLLRPDDDPVQRGGRKLTDLFGNYRFLYAWDFVFTLLALALPWVRVFVLWKQ